MLRKSLVIKQDFYPAWRIAIIVETVRSKVGVVLKNKKKVKPDKREYTIMLVPHQAESVYSIKIPIKAVKVTAGALCAALVIATGATIHYGNIVREAQSERFELTQLRVVNGQQKQQISNLAKETTTLKQDMDRIAQLETEVRRLISSDESSSASRSGSVRVSSIHTGQGGGSQLSANQLTALVKDMKTDAKLYEQNLKSLREELVARNERLAAIPSIWPTDGDVTSRFGWRSSPWDDSSDWHPGIDIANDSGTPIYAAASGVVVHSGWYSGYGRTIEIDHGNGIITLYGHNSELEVEVGQYVQKGELISYMGSTGYSTGPHLHYEVRINGSPVNPAKFL